MKPTDITTVDKNKLASALNSIPIVKNVKIYDFNGIRVIKTIKKDNSIQITATAPTGTPTGAPSIKFILSILLELTNKDITQFKISYSEYTIYLLEMPFN